MSSLDDFEIIALLGQGSFSEVFQVRRKSDGEIYAMKRVKMTMLKDKEKQNALNEVRILASLNQKYVIGYKEAFFDEDSKTLNIVMEHADGGDISKMIKNKVNTKTYINETEIWRALIHMAYGLKTLHDRQILHRDLKSANVFKCIEAYKLGDLNVSKVAKSGLVYTQTGTPYYASPEIWRDEPYDAKSDIWSLGCVIYEMCALKPPFMATDMAGLYSKIQKGTFPSIPNRYSSELSHIITQLLRLNASTRPSCEQILTHPYVIKMGGQFLEENDPNKEKMQLLKTIQLPKNGFLGLSEKLPGKKYEKEIFINNKENHCIFRIQQQLNLKIDRRQPRSRRHEHTNVVSSEVCINSCLPSDDVKSQHLSVENVNIQSVVRHAYKLTPIISSKPPRHNQRQISPTSNKVSFEYNPDSQDRRLNRVCSVQEETPRQNVTPSKVKSISNMTTIQLGQLLVIGNVQTVST